MSFHVTILAAGTRGDVQPYVALALGLQDQGHEVTLAANAELGGLVTAYGVPFHPLSVDFLAYADTPEGREALKGRPLVATRRLQAATAPMIRRMLDDAWAAAQDTDAVVYHPKTLAGPHLAERLGVPAVVGAAVPMLSPTRAFPVPGIKPRRLGRLGNKLSWKLAGAAANTYRRVVNDWRREVLDLPAAPHGTRDVAPDGTPLPKLYAYSEHVLPRPADWGEDSVVTGYWTLPAPPGWEPDPALTDFLAAGPPPVYVGFGSMPQDDPAATARKVVAGLRAAGVRGVIAGLPFATDAHGAGAGPPLAGDDMLAIGDVPHAWLFERVAAVVHHGGAGTTGAGLRAGRPTVIFPQAVDQPFWARAVHAIGASPPPLERLDDLAGAVTAARSLHVAELGLAIRSVDGVGNAVRRVAHAPAFALR
jgi:sterol 3beta-glucosyltransferase